MSSGKHGKKPSRNNVVLVAMSGGVDSSVSAALLKEQGYDVQGVMLRLWSEPGPIAGQRDNRCCTRDQMLDAHFVAKQLGIPFEVINASHVFKERIVDPFVNAYLEGLTPNPCLHCNRLIRFGYLLKHALEHGAQLMATGHYARTTRLSDGSVLLRKGIDPSKDQSYVLSMLTQEQLRQIIFPIGGLTKEAVRDIAQSLNLPVAGKRDSQDLCFIADGDYRRFIRQASDKTIVPGPIAHTSGVIIGTHSGLVDYTIGQRRGLGISWHEPLYVIRKDKLTNTLIVGPRAEPGKSSLQAYGVNWIKGSPPTAAFDGSVKIRYTAKPVPAMITPIDQTGMRVDLKEPLPDITPGQSAVVYDDEIVIASGIILPG
nr:tRNA 2-thiouridine(34) synthase MnmA [Anaerolineae bacterium]